MGALRRSEDLVLFCVCDYGGWYGKQRIVLPKYTELLRRSAREYVGGSIPPSRINQLNYNAITTTTQVSR